MRARERERGEGGRKGKEEGFAPFAVNVREDKEGKLKGKKINK